MPSPVRPPFVFALLLASTLPAQGQPVAGELGEARKHDFVSRPGVLELTGQMIVRPRQDLYAQNNPNPGARASDLVAPEIRARQARQQAPADPARARIADHILEHFPEVDQYVVRVPAGMDENAYADLLMATGDYEFVEPNWLCFPTETVPNDPQFGNSWQHTRLQSAQAWSIETGMSDMVVAIVDSGIDLDHPDLVGSLVPGMNSASNVTQANGGLVDDINGHGTFCAGVAAARGNNGNQVVGVGWNFSLMPIRATNRQDGTAFSTDLDQGARWAAENGADVINVSFSGVQSQSVQITALYAKTQGALYFRSAGNDGAEIIFEHEDAVIVGASTSGDNRAGFSNFGQAIDVFAPGQGVRGTRVGGSTGNSSGTSFASPIAAGVAAMIRSVNPELKPTAMQQILYASTDDLGPTGEDDIFGHGRVNTLKAVTNAQQTLGVAPIILEQPEGLVACEMDRTFLRLNADSSFFNDSLQWLKDGQPIPGATDLTLDLGSYTADDSGTYVAEFTNQFGTTLSEPAVILIHPPFALTQDLQPQTAFPGQDVSFSFEINNPIEEITWLVNGSPVEEFSNSLTLSNVSLEDDGTQIRAIITGSCGVADSTVELTVIPEPEPCPADVNQDGSLNGLDFGAWLGAFNAGLPTADQNADGAINGLDFGAWLANFNAGCD